MRVVLDTNILISACLKPNGLEALMVAMVLSGRLTACITEEIWSEYREVLYRAKFAAVRTKAAELLNALDRLAVRFTSGPRLAAAKEEDDNRFLECAVAAGARYLVTGNLKHYPSEWEGIRIVNTRGFLESGLEIEA